MSFDQNSTTEQVIEEVDLEGKVAVVTGASAGLGIETVRTLSHVGATVVLVARDAGKLEAVREQLGAGLPADRLQSEIMDLASLASVREAANAIAARYPRIHLLINNAGVMACPLTRTADGFELQFGTNHLGHFLFTNLLVPSLLAAAPARVVNLSSSGHRFSNVDFEDTNYERRPYDKWEAYGQSKTANVLFSVALNHRLADRGVTANAVHPGVIQTELGRHLTEQDIADIQARAGEEEFVLKTTPQGAATSIWAATAPDLEGRGGLFLEDCHIAEPAAEGVTGGVQAYALDVEAAERLWQRSEEWVGETFDWSG
jgi:NAD(P)-dependent dehydrogenase (short-subunit alcohol dehydrogenase family)